VTVEFRAFESRPAANQTLADEVARLLGRAVAERGQALLLAGGGVTPIALYQALSAQPLPWGRVTALPTDARWLPETDEGSNEGLLRRTLLQGPAAAARLEPLYGPEPAPEAALPRLRALIAGLPRPDVALMGVGEDGHTASLFPGAPGLAAALDPTGTETIFAIEAANAAATAQRLTLTMPVLLSARTIRVLIFGDTKRAVFEQAMQPGPIEAMPIRAVLRQTETPVEVVWAL
jgi:6-phosphogluconolactonase